jgi:hypothetical protein
MKKGLVSVIATLLVMAGVADARDTVIRSQPIPDLRMLWLDTNACTPQLTSELEDAGYTFVASRKEAEGSLRVNVRQLDANTGASARFSATLRNQDGKSVWETTGREDSISQEELCEDISEDIADRLERRKEAIS